MRDCHCIFLEAYFSIKTKYLSMVYNEPNIHLIYIYIYGIQRTKHVIPPSMMYPFSKSIYMYIGIYLMLVTHLSNQGLITINRINKIFTSQLWYPSYVVSLFSKNDTSIRSPYERSWVSLNINSNFVVCMTSPNHQLNNK